MKHKYAFFTLKCNSQVRKEWKVISWPLLNICLTSPLRSFAQFILTPRILISINHNKKVQIEYHVHAHSYLLPSPRLETWRSKEKQGYIKGYGSSKKNRRNTILYTNSLDTTLTCISGKGGGMIVCTIYLFICLSAGAVE